MTGIEGNTARSYPALLSAMKYHLGYASPGMRRIESPNDEFIRNIRKEMLGVPVRNVHEFMNSCTTSNNTQILPVGQLLGMRPEGFIFSAVNSGNPLLAKIYNGSGISRDMVTKFVNKAFPIAGSEKSGRKPKEKTPQEIVIDNL